MKRKDLQKIQSNLLLCCCCFFGHETQNIVKQRWHVFVTFCIFILWLDMWHDFMLWTGLTENILWQPSEASTWMSEATGSPGDWEFWLPVGPWTSCFVCKLFIKTGGWIQRYSRPVFMVFPIFYCSHHLNAANVATLHQWKPRRDIWGLSAGCPVWSCMFITKGSLLAGYLEFYFAKQRGGLDPLSLNDQEKGTPPSPPSKGTLAICLVSLFTQQPLRSVSSSSPSSSSTSSSSSSSSSPSSFDLKFEFFDIHFPSTRRCDESDRFEHP